MKSLILCEGKSDAILLSYYLGRTCGWSSAEPPKGFSIEAEEQKGESAYWYTKEEKYLLICGVGGKDKFQSFFNDKIAPMMIDASAFEKIAIVMDRDEQDDESIIKSLQQALAPAISLIEVDKWITNVYQNSFGQEVQVEALAVIIPSDKEGVLESMLLDAISEKEYDGIIVKRCIEYVHDIQPIAERYISKRRLKLKACLGVTWAIQSPEKVFTFIDTQIRSVKWEESELLRICFRNLRDI
jgi:hypothetical protein